MQKLVIQNAGSQCRTGVPFLLILSGLFSASDATLTQNRAIFLSGDLLGHFKHHFYECFFREALRSMKEEAGLAEIVNHSFMPAAQILYAVSYRSL